jgi:hypothetical protein
VIDDVAKPDGSTEEKLVTTGTSRERPARPAPRPARARGGGTRLRPGAELERRTRGRARALAPLPRAGRARPPSGCAGRSPTLSRTRSDRRDSLGRITGWLDGPGTYDLVVTDQLGRIELHAPMTSSTRPCHLGERTAINAAGAPARARGRPAYGATTGAACGAARRPTRSATASTATAGPTSRTRTATSTTTRRPTTARTGARSTSAPASSASTTSPPTRALVVDWGPLINTAIAAGPRPLPLRPLRLPVHDGDRRQRRPRIHFSGASAYMGGDGQAGRTSLTWGGTGAGYAINMRSATRGLRRWRLLRAHRLPLLADGHLHRPLLRLQQRLLHQVRALRLLDLR